MAGSRSNGYEKKKTFKKYSADRIAFLCIATLGINVLSAFCDIISVGFFDRVSINYFLKLKFTLIDI